jgi:hypothetical protein
VRSDGTRDVDVNVVVVAFTFTSTYVDVDVDAPFGGSIHCGDQQQRAPVE